MTWFRVDDRLGTHPKLDALAEALGGDWQAYGAACSLWLLAGCWSAQHGTGGHVPRHRLHMLAHFPAEVVDRAVDALVFCRLWDATPKGIAFHDWDDFNPSEDDAAARKAEQKERKRLNKQRERDRKRGVAGDCRRPVATMSPATVADVAGDSRHDVADVAVSRAPTCAPTRATEPEPEPDPEPEPVEERENARAAPAPLSLLPDEDPAAAKRHAKLEQRARVESLSRRMIGYLNQRTGKRFDPMGDANLAAAGKLLDWYDKAGRGGAKQAHEDVHRVVDAKVAEWGSDPKMAAHLKPGTLFRLSNFQRYVDEAGAGQGTALAVAGSAGTGQSAGGLRELAGALAARRAERERQIDVDE